VSTSLSKHQQHCQFSCLDASLCVVSTKTQNREREGQQRKKSRNMGEDERQEGNQTPIRDGEKKKERKSRTG
jgi:hypothetical protein